MGKKKKLYEANPVKPEIKSDEVFEKEVNQLGTIDETVDKVIKDMGFIWKRCTTKLQEDNVCFLCKGKIGENDKFDIIEVPSHKVDKGLFILSSICKQCNK